VILIGQYDSPFVRRVAVTLKHYGLPYEHRPWSVFADAEALGRVNPLRRVPVLVLLDGVALVDSAAIVDALDEIVGEARALLPRTGPMRREGLRIASLAAGLADKSVALVYERVLRPENQRNAVWIARCQTQIRDTLAALEVARAATGNPWWLGERLSHAGVIVGTALRFLGEAHPTLYAAPAWPRLAAHATACEALPEFQAVVQPFAVDLGD
jgi:glutathione S-transferase